MQDWWQSGTDSDDRLFIAEKSSQLEHGDAGICVASTAADRTNDRVVGYAKVNVVNGNNAYSGGV